MQLSAPNHLRCPTRIAFLAVASVLATIVGCGTTHETTHSSAPAAPSAATAADQSSPQRMASAPPIVQQMIEAHGGMEAWASAPSVYFEDLWGPGPIWSRIQVEQGNRRALIDYPGTEMRMGWNGEQAWSANWEAPYPPRFFALLNYYFLNLPWLTLDPGVVLEETGTTILPGDPVEYRTVKMTFEDGVGDTPDDYYDLLIHPETHRLHANRYIVTYSSILPEGVEHTPEHLLVYDTSATVDGLVVPTAFTIYEDGEVYATCQIRNWSFQKPFDESRLEMPAEAVIDESQP